MPFQFTYTEQDSDAAGSSGTVQSVEEIGEYIPDANQVHVDAIASMFNSENATGLTHVVLNINDGSLVYDVLKVANP